MTYSKIIIEHDDYIRNRWIKNKETTTDGMFELYRHDICNEYVLLLIFL